MARRTALPFSGAGAFAYACARQPAADELRRDGTSIKDTCE